jgi:prevent-host-death family protein
MAAQLDITLDTQPLTAFRNNSTEFIKQLKQTQRPIVLTVNGKPETVLQDPAAYQRLLDLAAEADPREGIRQGLEELHRGEGRPASEFFGEMRVKHGIPR